MWYRLAIVYVALLLVGGCGHTEAPSPDVATQEGGLTASAKTSGETAGAPDASPGSAQPVNYSVTDRMVLRTATVTVETADARKAVRALTAVTKKMGGYVGNVDEQTDPLSVRSMTVELHVPAARFDDLMAAVDRQGTVLNRHTGIQDITEEFIDLDARFRNLKRTEERLLSHLQRTARLADTLAVERELSRVRMEIEQLEGRLRFLKHHTSFSSVTVLCTEKARAGPMAPPNAYSSGEVATSAARSLVDFARSLWSVMIWVVVWSPVWLTITVLLKIRAHRRRQRSTSRTVKSANPPDREA